MTPLGIVLRVLLSVSILAAIYLTSLYNQLLFFIVVELCSIVVCFCIFIVAWHSRSYADNRYFTFLGIAFIFIGILELFHTMTFEGMPFSQFGQNVQMQARLGARYIQSLAMLAAPFFINRGIKIRLTITGFTLVCSLLLASIFLWQTFPACYVEGEGTTLFYVASEFLICSMFIMAGGLLWIRRSKFNRLVLNYLLFSLAAGVVAEAAFMLYRTSTGVFNLLGYLFYLVSFFLIYRAIVVVHLVKPYDILFHNLAREKDKLQNLLDTEESVLVALDQNENVTMINRKGRELIGLNEEDIVGTSWFYSFVPASAREGARQDFEKLVTGQSDPVKYLERPLLTSSGEERIIAWHEALLRDETGRIVGTFSSGQDITERKQAEDLFRVIFNNSPIGMYIVQDNRFTLVNPQFRNYLGYSESELKGVQPLSLVLPEDAAKVRQEAVRALKERSEQFKTYDYRVKTKSGQLKWFMESVTSIHYDGRLATLGTIVDVSERKQSEELFKSLSLIDDLTGVYNRRGFLTMATQQLKLSYRMNKGVTLLFADIDKLKWINDHLGHLEGDSALVNAARMLKETFRESDIVGRISGDEFAVFMPGSDDSYSKTIIQRLEDKISKFNSTAKKAYRLSLSFGMASSQAGAPCNLSDLLEMADKFMYQDKRNGQ